MSLKIYTNQLYYKFGPNRPKECAKDVFFFSEKRKKILTWLITSSFYTFLKHYNVSTLVKNVKEICTKKIGQIS